MSRGVRIASCSIMPAKWDKDANKTKMLDFMNRAMAGSPDLITTPEGCLEGYVVNEATAENRYDDLMALAEPEDGPVIAEFRSFCRDRKVNALVCFCELDDGEGYNTALWINREGETAGKYRKTHLAEGYNDSWYHNRPGMSLNAFDTDLGRVGVMICFDRRVPEVARSLMLDGAQMLFAPSYGGYTGTNDPVIISRAHENALPLVFTHPNKTVVINAYGDVMVTREQEDEITYAVIEPGDPDNNYMRKLRRPELYGRLLDS